MSILSKNTVKRKILCLLVAIFPLFLISCTDNGYYFPYGRRGKSQSSTITGAGGVYKVGDPYEVDGIWYYPKENYSYNETGIASWYGSKFHNNLTANGEIYDMNTLTAAHKTLPLPSVVRVTNLENGRSLVLRVNDRGPFVNNRVIDISRRGSQLLGFKEQGTAKVRVELLPKESKDLKNKIINSKTKFDLDKYNKEEVQEEMKAEAKETVAVAQYQETTPRPAYLPRLANQPPANIIPTTVKTEKLQAVKTVIESKALTKTLSGKFVQVGAFSSEANAIKLKEKLSTIGDVYISQVDVNAKTLYRVRLGPVDSAYQANETLSKVRAFGYDGARFVDDTFTVNAK